jgi:hypothetical protein
MNLLKYQLINSLLIIVLTSTVFSQNKEDFKNYKLKYPESNVVFNSHNETVTIDFKDGVPNVKTNTHDEYLILNQIGVSSMTSDEIYFSTFETIENIDAYSMIPTDKGYKKVKATNFVTKEAENEGSVFHDDNKTTSFIYPSLTEGSYRVLDYTQTTSENRFPFGFFFCSYIPIDKAKFIIDCDSNIHIIFKLFNDQKNNVKYTENIIKGRRIMEWTITNPMILKQEERAVNSRYYAPHIMAQIANYRTKKGVIEVVGNANDLHNWYKTHIQKVLNEEPSEELKQITDSITKLSITEKEKVKSIYYWVQSNIKYIAFEEGINGFVPRQPNAILAKRYGDCKDMASLIYTMLKYAKIKSYLTWLGTKDLPYKYSEFPSSICDNHMITTYLDGDKPYFLDATCSFLPFGYPSHGIIGKEAFLHISDNEYRILNIPTMRVEDTYYRDSSFIQFDNRKIIGKNKTIVGGYYNIYVNEIYNTPEQKKLNEIVESMHQKGNNTFKIINSSTQNVGNRDLDLIVNYDFEINNYVTSYENEVYVNMVLDKEITQGELKLDRIAPFELDNLSNDEYTVVMEVPKEYTIKSIPKDTSFTSDYVDYSIQYKKDKNKITMTVKLNLKFLYLYPESFPKWNEFTKIMKSSMVETVVLLKK